MMKKYVLFLIFAIMCAVNGYSQDFSFMKQNLDWQVYNYPQEKIHVMTNLITSPATPCGFVPLW